MSGGTLLTTPRLAQDELEPGALVRFFGVRGSTPCEGPQIARYGGHSSCVVIDAVGNEPIVFDLGTGVRPYGIDHGYETPFHGSVLLTHLHWDHVQGLPFFTPLHNPSTSVAVYGPRQAEGELGDVFEGMMRPPYFPIRPTELGGTINWHAVGDDDFALGRARVRSRFVPHVGPTLGFRVEINGISVAYISDHGPGCCGTSDRAAVVPLDVLELCDGVDLLIHDAQHTPEEFAQRSHWGHCTPSYAVHVARESGAKRLALFHHDPSHDDDQIDQIALEMADEGAARGVDGVFAAAEGMVLSLEPSAIRGRRP